MFTFDLEHIITVLESIDKLKESIDSNITNYMENKVPVQDAIFIRDSAIAARNILYSMIERCNDPEVNKILKSFNFNELKTIESEITEKIPLASCIIAMLDRYIAEYYVTKLEQSHASCIIDVELRYVTSFRDLKKTHTEDKEQ